jgi:hypothetical protein
MTIGAIMKFKRSQHDAPDSGQRRRWRRLRIRREPRPPDLEPPHDQPWVPTNQLADRVRRSPRE